MITIFDKPTISTIQVFNSLPMEVQRELSMTLGIPFNYMQSTKKSLPYKSIKKGMNTKKNSSSINGNISQAHSFFHSTKNKDENNSSGIDDTTLPLQNQLHADDVVIIEEK